MRKLVVDPRGGTIVPFVGSEDWIRVASAYFIIVKGVHACITSRTHLSLLRDFKFPTFFFFFNM